MPQQQNCSVTSPWRVLALAALLLWCGVAGMAQHTVVEKNGVGGRIETDYNAANKATQMRTIAPDGKVQQKVEYEYQSGNATQQTDTTYWSSGVVRKMTRNTYDESSNFTGEFVQVFDESGKQIAGHKLTHDPWTGVYRCSEWNVAVQDYRAVHCPAGEEDRGGAGEVETFTYDEVMMHVEAARETARRERQSEKTIRRMQAETSVPPRTTRFQQVVGLVLPARVHPGERVSGTVVVNVNQYREMPEVVVTWVTLPFESVGEASPLSGWLFETAGEQPQRADGPITLIVPRDGSDLKTTFREAVNPSHRFFQTLTFPQVPEKESSRLNSFQAPALCMKDELCVVNGPFSGDSGQTFAVFEDRPAKIVAETSGAAYLEIPELAEPGSRPLIIAEGGKVVAFHVAVGTFVIKNNGRELQAGETLITFPTLDGPGDIRDPAWRIGDLPVRNLGRARQFVPGFQLSQGASEAGEKLETEHERESKEKQEVEEKKQEGEILLVIQNITPEQISLRGSRNEMLVFHLREESFRRGEFKYDLMVEAKKAGKVEVKGYVIPFVAPVVGQEFSIKAAR